MKRFAGIFSYMSGLKSTEYCTLRSRNILCAILTVRLAKYRLNVKFLNLLGEIKKIIFQWSGCVGKGKSAVGWLDILRVVVAHIYICDRRVIRKPVYCLMSIRRYRPSSLSSLPYTESKLKVFHYYEQLCALFWL